MAQFHLYLEAAIRRENRAFFDSVIAGQYAWAGKEATDALRRDVFGE